MTALPGSDSDVVTSTLANLQAFASPAASRNAVPIAKALAPLLPKAGLVLEVAAGNGYHAAILASHFPHLTWQPTDPNANIRMAAMHVVDHAQLGNLLPPLDLRAEMSVWPVTQADAVLCCNMIHIAPWSAAEGLMRGAAQVLRSGAALFLYGPLILEGMHTAPSNAAFDQSLRAQNPTWGVRDTADVNHIAASQGLVFEQQVDMPANNMIRVYRRTD